MSMPEDSKDAVAKEVATEFAPSKEVESSNTDDNPEYAGPLRLALIVVILCAAGFLYGLDQTIVATAVPNIANSFHALGDIAWWTSAYLLTSASLQLVYGRLYTLFSVKHIFNLAIAIFALGSLICTVAPNSLALILGRAIAGCGAAGISTGCVLILVASCPLEKRASHVGFVFMATGLASVAGPFVGGALADRASWRWCFGINMLICAVIMAGVAMLVRTPHPEEFRAVAWREKVQRLDLPVSIVLTAALVCLVLALQLGGVVYPWPSGRVVALFVVAGALVLSFVGIQVFVPSQRSFSSDVVRNRNIPFGAMYSGFITGCLFVVLTYTPLWFQAVENVSALWSGVMVAPMAVSFVVAAALAGVATQVIGYYNPSMFFGTAFAAVGAGLLSTFTPDITSAREIGYQVVFGIGVGAGVPAGALVAQTVLPISDVPIGVAIVSLNQTLWASVVVAIAQTVFLNELKKGIARVIPGFDTSILVDSGASNLGTLYPSDQLQKVLPVYSKAITSTFYIAVALGCGAMALALPLQWRSMKNKK